METHKSVADMAANKFRNMLNRFLNADSYDNDEDDDSEEEHMAANKFLML